MTFSTKFLISLSLLGLFVPVCPSAVASSQTPKQEKTPTDSKATQDKNGNATEAKAAEWKTLRPTGARAEFMMPVKPRYVERKFQPVKGRDPIVVKLHLGKTENGRSLYIFSYHDMFQRPRSEKAIDNTLEGAVRGSLTTVNGVLTSEGVTKIKYLDKFPGRQFAYTYQQNGNDYVALSRIYLVRDRQYQLTTLMHESAISELLAGKFVNSFKLYTPEPDLPPVPRNR